MGAKKITIETFIAAQPEKYGAAGPNPITSRNGTSLPTIGVVQMPKTI
jgi:hypothetical protein